MKLNQREKATLALLVTVGATAMDCGVTDVKKREFEEKFGVKIATGDVTSVINKVADLLSGSENVIID